MTDSKKRGGASEFQSQPQLRAPSKGRSQLVGQLAKTAAGDTSARILPSHVIEQIERIQFQLQPQRLRDVKFLH